MFLDHIHDLGVTDREAALHKGCKTGVGNTECEVSIVAPRRGIQKAARHQGLELTESPESKTKIGELSALEDECMNHDE